MEDKKTHWGILAVIAFIVLLLVGRILLPPPKARASRIQAVNHIESVSMTLLRTNTPPTATTKK